MLISQSILLLLITSGMFIYGGLSSPKDFLAYAVFNGVNGLVYGLIICGIATIYYSITKLIYHKKVNKTQNEITITKKLKEEYEKELSNIKQRQLITKSQTISINEPVSLIEKTKTMETQIHEELNRIYIESINQRPKKLY